MKACYYYMQPDALTLRKRHAIYEGEIVKKLLLFAGLVALFVFGGCGQGIDLTSPLPDNRLAADNGNYLVAHYAMDEFGGDTIYDSSINSYDGTPYGPAPIATDHGGGWDFDGVDDWMAFPNSAGPPPEELNTINYGTISVWFKVDEFLNDGVLPEVLPIFYYGKIDRTNAVPECSVEVYIGHNHMADPNHREIYFTVLYNDFPSICWATPFSVQAGEWYHYVVIVGPDGDHRGYVNGEEFEKVYKAGSGPTSHGWFATTPLDELMSIGHGSFGVTGTWWHFNGAIDDLRIYNYPLSEEEVVELYNTDLNIISPPNGHTYEVWSDLDLQWDGDPGYNGKYYLDTKYNGVPVTAFSGLQIGSPGLTLPPKFMDTMADYGTWQWRVYTKDSPTGPNHYSDWWTLYKTPPELQTPADGATIDNTTLFSWNKPPSVNPSGTWYVAKVTGDLLPGPAIAWWTDVDHGYVPAGWYNNLLNMGGGEFQWTVAAVSGDPSSPGGTGMTMDYASKIKYPPARTCYITPE